MEILPCLFLAHIFFMNNTFPHIRTNLFLTHSFFSFSLPPTQKNPLSLGKLPYPFLELIPLVQWKLRNLPLQLWPFHPLRANENWE